MYAQALDAADAAQEGWSVREARKLMLSFELHQCGFLVSGGMFDLLSQALFEFRPTGRYA